MRQLITLIILSFIIHHPTRGQDRKIVDLADIIDEWVTGGKSEYTFNNLQIVENRFNEIVENSWYSHNSVSSFLTYLKDQHGNSVVFNDSELVRMKNIQFNNCSFESFHLAYIDIGSILFYDCKFQSQGINPGFSILNSKIDDLVIDFSPIEGSFLISGSQIISFKSVNTEVSGDALFSNNILSDFNWTVNVQGKFQFENNQSPSVPEDPVALSESYFDIRRPTKDQYQPISGTKIYFKEENDKEFFLARIVIGGLASQFNMLGNILTDDLITISVNTDKALIENNTFMMLSIIKDMEFERLEILQNNFLIGLMLDTDLDRTSLVIQWEDLIKNLVFVDLYSGEYNAYHILSDSVLLKEVPYNSISRLLSQLISEYSNKGQIETADLVEATLKNFRSHEDIRKASKMYREEGGPSNLILWKSMQLRHYFRSNMALLILAVVIFTIVLVWYRVILKRGKKKSSNTAQKRLAALVFTDIVGYTAMMGKDEKLTLETIETNRKLHLQNIDRYHGQLLKEMGDGMLCSFSTASDSVHFCIDVQRQLRKLNSYKLRMGIHLGEVVYSKGDVFGDGVNIASRLQGEASEGAICISDSVFQNIKNQSDIDVSFLGERELKHVSSKIRMYEVRY